MRFEGLTSKNMEAFLVESNAIEGIHDPPSDADIEGAIHFVEIEAPSLRDVENLVSTFPGHPRLRSLPGMNVRVGSHFPPPGGPGVENQLKLILSNVQYATPYRTHVAYETLHPFVDGNGRSGRLIWLWQMLRQHGWPRLGFLHTYYYQSLDGAR